MYKRVAFWQGISRNYGDMAINVSMKKLFRENTNHHLDFLDINSDITYDPQGYRGYPVPVLSKELIQEINETCDLFVVGGGGQIMARAAHESVSGWQFNVSQDNLAALKIPLVAYGIGYNKFPKDQNFFQSFKKHLGATYKKCELFSVRNTGTADIVRQTIDQDDPIYLISDPAMFLESKPLEIPALGTGPVLGINWAGDAPSKRFSMTEEHELFMNLLTFCRRFIKETGGKVLYIPHIMYYDFEKFKDFKEHLGDGVVGLHIECPWMFPESLLATPLFAGAYKRCTAVLGMRGHANIIPFGQGVPSYGYGTQDKVKFFQEEVGGSFLGNDPSACYDKVINDVFAHRTETLRKIQDKREELFKITENFTRMTLSYLD